MMWMNRNGNCNAWMGKKKMAELMDMIIPLTKWINGTLMEILLVIVTWTYSWKFMRLIYCMTIYIFLQVYKSYMTMTNFMLHSLKTPTSGIPCSYLKLWKDEKQPFETTRPFPVYVCLSFLVIPLIHSFCFIS